MEKRNVNTNLVAALLVVIAVLGYGLIGRAGIGPDAPPGDTMKTLQEIYDAVVTEGSRVSEREGFCEFFTYGGLQENEMYTVPEGKRLVILKFFLYNVGDEWELKVDGEKLLDGQMIYTGYSDDGRTYMWDFPDRCVVFNAGEVLSLKNDLAATINCTIIGYLYDVP